MKCHPYFRHFLSDLDKIWYHETPKKKSRNFEFCKSRISLRCVKECLSAFATFFTRFAIWHTRYAHNVLQLSETTNYHSTQLHRSYRNHTTYFGPLDPLSRVYRIEIYRQMQHITFQYQYFWDPT